MGHPLSSFRQTLISDSPSSLYEQDAAVGLEGPVYISSLDVARGGWLNVNGVLGRGSIGGDNVEGSRNLLSLAMCVSLRCYGSTKGSS